MNDWPKGLKREIEIAKQKLREKERETEQKRENSREIERKKMRITVRIYNATGAALSIVPGGKYNWDGDYDSSPPDIIKANGEAVFEIVKEGSDATGGAVVYRVLDPSILNPSILDPTKKQYDCMVAFSNPNSGQNKVLCKCRQQDHFDDDAMKYYKQVVNDSQTPFNSDVSGNIIVTTAAITREDSATCFATIGKFVT